MFDALELLKGNLGALLCLVMIWKLDRRLVRIETLMPKRRDDEPGQDI